MFVSSSSVLRMLPSRHLLKTRKFCLTSVAKTTTGYKPPAPEKHVQYSPIPPLDLPQENLHHLLFTRASRWTTLDAMECGVTGRKYTYGELMDYALRWGTVLSRLNSSSGSLKGVASLCQNAPEFPIIFLGSLAAGTIFAPINSNYSPEEVAHQLADSGSEVIVTDPQLEQVVTKALTLLKKTIPVFVNGNSALGHPNLRQIIQDTNIPFIEPVQSPLESTALILYSSGTTGNPKGVLVSHRAVTAALGSCTHPHFYSYQAATAETQETVMGVMPFYHLYGAFIVNLMNQYLGAKIVSSPAFVPQDFMRVIKDHKIRVVHLVPPLLNFLVGSPSVTSSDLDSIRVVLIAGAPVLPTAAEAMKQKAPNPVLFQEAFGMTETIGGCMTPLEEEQLGWCGKPFPNVEAKVVNTETGEALPEGQRGELCIRSPSVMTGYHNNPEATAETIDAEGWLHTGDVALHQDGCFCIVDRIKDLIKVKGFQVSPSEIEDLLLKHPGVADVAVLGVHDDRAGELPRAYVVRRDNNTTEDDLHKFLEPKVAKFKQLKGGIKFMDSLPKLPTGKVLRRELKKMANEDL